MEKQKQKEKKVTRELKLKELINQWKIILISSLIVVKEILVYIHQNIKRTWQIKKIYSSLFIIVIYLFNFWTINSFTIMKYNTMLFDYNISTAKADLITKENKKSNEEQKLDSVIKDTLINQIESTILSEKKYCISKEILKFKEDVRQHSFILPSEETITFQKIELSKTRCSVKYLWTDVYWKILIQIFGKESLVYKKYKESWMWVPKRIKEITSRIIEQEKDSYKREVKKLKKVALDKRVYMTWSHFKSNTETRAIFCIYWHWLWRTWIDNWARVSNQLNKEYNKENERSLIMKIMPTVCTKIKEKYRGTHIKVYEIWKKKMTLIDKIKEINQISKENWYNEKNSIWVSLHFNKANSKTRSWIEVYYSQLEGPNKGFQGKDFASNMLSYYQKLDIKWNMYKYDSDSHTRFRSLWILSDTKPLVILVESWFLSSQKDVPFILNNISKIEDTLIKWVTSFVRL